MNTKQFLIKKKLPGLVYAITPNGVELPVLDITHPLFLASIDTVQLRKMISKAAKTADKTADRFINMPAYLKRFLSRRSFIISELLHDDGGDAFLTGLSTLMLKLGPNLIGKGKKRLLDRLSSRGIGGMVLRMRVRDISKCQANSLVPLLETKRDRPLCLVNIAGGAASDSINTIMLILQASPALLENRKIEINVLDIDTYGPAFAETCVSALKSPGGAFSILDVSFRHIPYDWNNTEALVRLLSERKEWIQVCASEGGIFEYSSDRIIHNNLDVLYQHAVEDVVVVGSLMRDNETIDPGAKAALRISTGIKPRFLGIDGLKKIIEKDKWIIDTTMEDNPRYQIARLKKVS